MSPVTALLGALAALTAVYAAFWTRAVMAARRGAAAQAGPVLTQTGLADDARAPTVLQISIGAVTNFFDSLGIGSFATTTAMWRATRSVPDRVIPGTLNAGHTIPVIAQAFIFTSIIPVDAVTLFAMIAAAVAGAWFGAGVVARLPRRKVQIGMGAALLAAATLGLTLGGLPAVLLGRVCRPRAAPLRRSLARRRGRRLHGGRTAVVGVQGASRGAPGTGGARRGLRGRAAPEVAGAYPDIHQEATQLLTRLVWSRGIP
jgi:hypothetical protein